MRRVFCAAKTSQLACSRKRLYNGGRTINKVARKQENVMAQFIQSLVENFVVLAAALVVLGLGWFSISYLSKRREMLHQERMASLVKGLHYAGVGKEIFTPTPTTTKKAPRNHTLSGLRWIFGGAGLSTALYGYASMQPYPDPSHFVQAGLAGIIPALIGLVHLLLSFLGRNTQTLPLPNLPIRTGFRSRPLPSRTLYR
jgi:hypothetical protein